jgi:hypothetical protein
LKQIVPEKAVLRTQYWSPNCQFAKDFSNLAELRMKRAARPACSERAAVLNN